MANRVTVYEDNGARTLLTENDHLATGGEGAVYLKNDTVFKVYLEPEKAIAAGMERKVQLLSAIRHPGIAAPTGVLRDKAGKLVGLTLPRAKGEALCKAFTNNWRDTNQFGPLETGKVVEAMRDITQVAHAHHALMVDANEMNWLLAGTAPTAIDSDSWQLPGFPATAIMPSIRDYNAKTFSEGSDWFAWAIVTFQLWTGIHPYKGTHPDFARGALEERMRAQVSVFDPKIRLPGAARPTSEIPQVLRNWYEAVFAGQDRSAPPSVTASPVAAQGMPRLRVLQSLSGALKMERLGNAGERIFAAFNGFVIAQQGKQLVAWDSVSKSVLPHVTEEELKAILRREAALVRTPTSRVVIQVQPGAVQLTARALETGESGVLPSRGARLWQSGNRVFALVEGVPNGLVELEVAQLGAKLVLTSSRQWPASVLSSQFLRGVLVQDCMGAPFLGVLEGNGLLQAPAPELREYRIAEGFAIDRHNVWLTGIRRRDGETVRLTLSHKTDRFQLEEVIVVPSVELEGASTTAGVGVLCDGEDLIVAKGTTRKRLPSVGLSKSMRIFSLGAGIGGFEGGEVAKISLG